MSGGPGGPYNAPPYNPPGTPLWAQTTQQQAQLAQVWQQIEQTLNAILTQLKTGISLVAQAPTFTFAALPAAATHPAMVAFASNGRKPGEGPGTGTGMLAFSDGVNWFGTDGTLLLV